MLLIKLESKYVYCIVLLEKLKWGLSEQSREVSDIPEGNIHPAEVTEAIRKAITASYLAYFYRNTKTIAVIRKMNPRKSHLKGDLT